MVLVPLYINETSPKNLRGAFGVTNQIFVVIGIAVAQFLGLFLSTIPYWRLILLFGGIIGALHFVLLLFACESPKWVALQSGGQTRASSILHRIRGEDSDHEVREWRRKSLLPTDNDGIVIWWFYAHSSRLWRGSARSGFQWHFCYLRLPPKAHRPAVPSKTYLQANGSSYSDRNASSTALGNQRSHILFNPYTVHHPPILIGFDFSDNIARKSGNHATLCLPHREKRSETPPSVESLQHGYF